MSEGKSGAIVQYCGHDGTFVADIFKIGNVNVVVANGPVTPDNITRPAKGATHHLEDFPEAGCWNLRRGFFAVPCEQVTDLRPAKKPQKKKKRSRVGEMIREELNRG
jgi:hypothetical protein